MALHCAATLLLVPVQGAGDAVAGVGEAAGTGLVRADQPPPGTDVIEELQALADLHRGERVVVPVAAEQLALVLEHLGRATAVGPGTARRPLRLEIGDDGWALAPTSG